jgi:hypothetical protein
MIAEAYRSLRANVLGRLSHTCNTRVPEPTEGGCGRKANSALVVRFYAADPSLDGWPPSGTLLSGRAIPRRETCA